MSRRLVPDQSWTPLFELPRLLLAPKAPRSAPIRHDRLQSSPIVETPRRSPGRFKCRAPECRKRLAYRSQSGLSVHLRAAHGIISESKWAVQKREVRARKRDPENAPPRRKPGPAPGTPKNRLCLRCRSDIRTVADTPLPVVALAPGDVEFTRKRMKWYIDKAAEKLAIDLGTTDEKVREAIWAVLSNRLAPPRAARRSVNPAAAYGTSSERPSMSWQV